MLRWGRINSGLSLDSLNVSLSGADHALAQAETSEENRITGLLALEAVYHIATGNSGKAGGRNGSAPSGAGTLIATQLKVVALKPTPSSPWGMVDHLDGSSLSGNSRAWLSLYRFRRDGLCPISIRCCSGCCSMSDFSGNTEIKMGSERSFGLVFATVFLIVALVPLILDGNVRIWALAVAGVLALIAFAAPDLLLPLNRLWFRLGLVLNRIVSPIVMGIIFFLAVTPTGIIRRVWNGDALQQRLDPDAETYWISVDPEHAARSSMKKQY